jgi:hypothetical protein
MVGLHLNGISQPLILVVELKLEDFKAYAKYGALAGMEFQKSIEQKAWHLAETQRCQHNE